MITPTYAEDEAGGCPYCGDDSGDCSHVVTRFDGTFPHALGMTRAAVEPHEPMGWDAVGALATAVFDLLEACLRREPPLAAADLEGVLQDLPETLRALVLAEHAGASWDEKHVEVHSGEYVAFLEWKTYVDDVIEKAAESIEARSDVVNVPTMASAYYSYWAPSGWEAADRANDRIYTDAESVRERIGTLGVKKDA